MRAAWVLSIPVSVSRFDHSISMAFRTETPANLAVCYGETIFLVLVERRRESCLGEGGGGDVLFARERSRYLY